MGPEREHFSLGLIRFGGHPRSGVQPREDVHHGEHGKKKPRPRRSFTPEFKAEIVELCRRGDRSVGQIAKDFDLTETAVRDWVKQAEVDAGERDGLTSSEREELAALRRENRRLREDVDILKRATAFFAKETR
ncbi:transposase [Streptomyces sp. NBC_00212]|uniref:transposase n=1 Tax=Streptomyces sp. NBC_00212 TaxID=2975684 RepID=UPI00386EBFAB